MIARFGEDKALYRSEVITSDPLTVRFVDYGYVQKISQNRNVYPVFKKLLDLPAQAVKCSLIGVSPRGKSFEERTLPLGCIFMLYCFLLIKNWYIYIYIYTYINGIRWSKKLTLGSSQGLDSSSPCDGYNNRDTNMFCNNNKFINNFLRELQ